MSRVSPDPPDLICAMFIVSVLYFCTETYWSTLERLNSCSVTKRTSWTLHWVASQPCTLGHPPRHEDSLNLDKCRRFLLSHTVGHQQEAGPPCQVAREGGLSQAPHTVGQRGWCILLSHPRSLLGRAKFYLESWWLRSSPFLWAHARGLW